MRAIQYSSRPGENALDLFGGSGSTLIACESAVGGARRCYMMEIDALYCDVIVERWEGFTGRKAQRLASEGVGIPAAEATAERLTGTMKAADEVAVMAADAGLISDQDDVIGVGGTGEGADTAIVLRPANSTDFFSVKVREIIAMPR